MRPVIRGPVPERNGHPRTVSDYKDWRQDLLDRIGNYCSYCNMTLNDSPQVEHVTAQDIDPGNRLNWHNMVLACGPCNRAKSNQPCPPVTHYLPDCHNTHLAFDYIDIVHPNGKQRACIPVPKTTLPPNQREKALRTIELCQLDALTNNPRATDLRWKYRWEALRDSLVWRNSWTEFFSHGDAALQDEFVNLLCSAALPKGFFSIWYNTFSDVPQIKKALVEAFPNTNPACFNIAWDPIPIDPNDL